MSGTYVISLYDQKVEPRVMVACGRIDAKGTNERSSVSNDWLLRRVQAKRNQGFAAFALWPGCAINDGPKRARLG